MFVVDYILIKKRDGHGEVLSDLSVNLAESHKIRVSELTQGWFLGRADGAPYSRIILCDRQGEEIMLLLKLDSLLEEQEVQDWVSKSGAVKVGSLRDGQEPSDLKAVPVQVFTSELESIKDRVNQVS